MGEGFDVPRAEDPEDPHAAYFWYSKEFETSVWTPPWDPKLFEVREVERDVFLEVCLDEFLLPHSPFNALLDKLPTDLWPNAEAYLEQLEGGETLFKVTSTIPPAGGVSARALRGSTR